MLTEHEPIVSFNGEHRWLSNFWPVELKWRDSLIFPSVEHAYQAMKSSNWDEMKNISTMTPGQAKRAGSRLEIRSDWDDIKVQVMTTFVVMKFSPSHLELHQKLIDTGDALLVEGNTWNDRYWGQCPVGTGENMLGRILMSTRRAIMR